MDQNYEIQTNTFPFSVSPAVFDLCVRRNSEHEQFQRKQNQHRNEHNVELEREYDLERQQHYVEFDLSDKLSQ